MNIINKKAHNLLNSKIAINMKLVTIMCILVLALIGISISSIVKINCTRRDNDNLKEALIDREIKINEYNKEREELNQAIEDEKNKNKELESEVSSLTQQLAARSAEKNILSSARVSSFKSYMDYRTITSIGSAAYELQKQAVTDENGLRKIDDYYCVAMGTHYGKVGDTLYIETDEGASWKVILADIKSDKHTDSTHSYTLSNGCMMEFIVDTSAMPRNIRSSGTVNGLGFQGNITVVKHI